MTKEEALRQIKQSGVVPVIRADSPTEAAKIVEAAFADGFRVFEITLTVPSAVELIKHLSEKFRERALFGAGTVLDAESARRCAEAGARFIVTPCLIEPVIEFCNREGVLICAGALTPTEVFRAWQSGADVVKIFPANAMGGASYIKSLIAPFPEIPLMPTGGLKRDDLAEFVSAGALAIGVGFKG